jgi:hypothetical protein
MLLVKSVVDDQLHLVKEQDLTLNAKRFLKSYVPEESEEVESSIEESEEVHKLRLLIRELKNDRMELKNELREFVDIHGNVDVNVSM